MCVIISFDVVAILTVCILPLLNGLKMQFIEPADVKKFQQSDHVVGRWRRAVVADVASCPEVQKRVDDRISKMSNVSRKLFADEVEFMGDNKYSLQMSWTGNDTEKVIVVTSEGGMSSVYLSDETSKNFQNITSHLAGATVNTELSLQKHPLAPRTVYIVAYHLFNVSSLLYVTNDAGKSFTKVPLTFLLMSSLVFHPRDPSYILALDKRGHRLFLSKNQGLKWSLIKSNVISFKWSTAPGLSDIFVITGQEFLFSDSKTNVLEKSRDFGQNWTPLYHNVFSFGSGGKFLFISAYASPISNERRLVVSTDAGTNWDHVQLPTITPDRFFSILDASEGQIFLHVDEPGDTGKGTLFLSDATGVVFTKSLEDHLYPNFQDLTDFYPVQSMRGVYIANQLSSDSSIRTVISYNRGGDWQPVERPENAPCEDETQKCSLHIHNAYSRARGIRANPPLSVSNAVGIILVHGHVASSLRTSDPDVFVSSDGGYNWRLALKGPHHYVIGDHGGLLVAVPAIPYPSVVKFSTDEGRCWLSYNFTEGRHPIQVTGVLIEPGNKAMMIAIWGYTEDRIWHTYFVNFTALIERRCGRSDYDEWVSHSHQAGGCLLGYNETFMRLKPDSWCYNGRAYVMSKVGKPCRCTVDDYDCDFGYMRQEKVDKCIEDPSLKDKKIHICRRNHEENTVAVGYHKIPGDKCKGGYFPHDAPSINLLEVCQNTDSSSGLSSKAKEHVEKPNATAVIIAIVVMCCVIGGAVAITLYARKRRLFAQSYHYMSIRSDDTKPLDTSVCESSDEEPILS